MEVRGERECTACGTRWSYYETGSVDCPNCGSVRSVAASDERREHTDFDPDFDVEDAVAAAGRDDYREAAKRAREAAREYVRGRGFVSGGDLRELDDAVLAAWELRYVASAFARSYAREEAEEFYFVSLLRGAPDGERPAASDVPDSLRGARGNGYADAVERYREDVRRVLDSVDRPAATGLLSSLDDHVRRFHALDGDVPPAEAETLVEAARAVGRYVRDGDDADRDAARDALAELAG